MKLFLRALYRDRTVLIGSGLLILIGTIGDIRTLQGIGIGCFAVSMLLAWFISREDTE